MKKRKIVFATYNRGNLLSLMTAASVNSESKIVKKREKLTFEVAYRL